MQRAHMYYGSTATEKMDRPYRRHYSEDGTMEITEDIQNGTTNFVFYLGGDAYSAPAIWKEIHHSNAQPLDAQLYFLHRDHLGSIVMITDAAGNIAEKRQFDAWGNIVKLENGNGVPLSAFVILDRGYTGHEHLLGVGLIHMNGRLYDPKLHRFLQPDNYVQDPYNSQNFNRYGYVYNNPLSHVDPSGELAFLAIVGIAALIGGSANLTVKIVQGKVTDFSSGLKAFGIGAVAGAAGAITGGAALGASGLAGASIAGGALAGAAGAAVASPIQGIGNMLFFGDRYSLKQWGKDVLFGGIAGGVVGGATALFKNKPTNVWWGDDVASGRTRFSFNNTAKYTSTNTNYSITIEGIQRNITPDYISEALDNFGIQAQVKNPIYKSVVDDYLNQMNNGTFNLKSGAGGFINGNQALITDGHHKIIAATIKGMQTGNYGILNKILNNSNFRQWSSSYGYNFSKFRTVWQ
ncbi:RHS repeat-associated core domain-containing protein [Pedobacter aquae]|uniref:RHS repeat-associated core domain-containing protein n=1 Tax=Pedobacter aquae TaxID=2605747 RepID=UPI001980C849|nr:RHS repeat-associated core domain-containing protein [Pedobacter aquae]